MTQTIFQKFADAFRNLRAQEELGWDILVHPQRLFSLLMRYGYIQFFIVGGSGVVINLGVTWALTTYVYGLQHYFDAYLFGLAANLVWNFMLYTFAIFKTKGGHARRLIVFTIYFLVVTWFNTLIVRAVTSVIGVQYYLFTIAGTILLLSTMNFFVFKLSLFKQKA
jgi:putative flippase GtrA